MPLRNVESSKLILLHILFRHGHRTPTTGWAYQGDPHKEGTYPPYGAGQLTKEGKIASYALGQYIKSEYGNFIGDMYTPGLVRPMSTENDRAQTTLQLFLAALFPPVGELIWNENLLWQPIPYKYYSRTNDKILDSCLRNEDFQTSFIHHQHEIGIHEKYKEIFGLLSEKLGFMITNLEVAWRFYLKLVTQREYGLELPEWTKPIFPQPLEDLAIEFYTSQMMLLAGLFTKIIVDTRNKLDRDGRHCPTKLHVYSAHELNIAQMLISTSSFIPPHMPKYCACIIFEIRKYKGEVFIGVLYKPDTYEKAKYLPLWGENPCRFNDFVKLFHDLNFK